MLFVCFVDLTHLHSFIVLLLFEISDLSAYFDLLFEVLILLFELFLVLGLGFLHELCCFFSDFIDGFRLVDTISIVQRLLFLLLFKLFFYFLLVSELFHFLRVVD